MSGPPKALLVMKSSGIGMNLSSLPCGRDDVDARLLVERLRGPAQLVHAGRRIEVALRVDAHAVGAAAGREVVVHPHVADRAIRLQIVRANQPRAALRLVRLDEVERADRRARPECRWGAHLRRREDARDLAGRVDPVDRAAVELGEVQPALAVDRHVVGPHQRPALVAVGEHLDLPGLQIGSRDPRRARRASRPAARTPRLRTRSAGPADRSAARWRRCCSRGTSTARRRRSAS